MDDLVRIPKISAGERNQSARHGRPARVSFALRNYGNVCFLAIPNGACEDGYGAEFFRSSTGFAIQLSPNGTRKVSRKKTTLTANVPLEVRNALEGLFTGSLNVSHTVMPDNTYFFSFADIQAAANNKKGAAKTAPSPTVVLIR